MFPNPYDNLDYAKSRQSSYIDQAMWDETAREIKTAKRQRTPKLSNKKNSGWLFRLFGYSRARVKKAYQ